MLNKWLIASMLLCHVLVGPSLGQEHFHYVLLQYMEIEDLVSTLESIVERFGEDIAPFAVTLCQQLVFAFWRMQVPTASCCHVNCRIPCAPHPARIS